MSFPSFRTPAFFAAAFFCALPVSFAAQESAGLKSIHPNQYRIQPFFPEKAGRRQAAVPRAWSLILAELSAIGRSSGSESVTGMGSLLKAGRVFSGIWNDMVVSQLQKTDKSRRRESSRSRTSRGDRYSDNRDARDEAAESEKTAEEAEMTEQTEKPDYDTERQTEPSDGRKYI